MGSASRGFQTWLRTRGMTALVVLLTTGANAVALEGADWRYKDIVNLIDTHEAQGKPFQSITELIAAFPEGLRTNGTAVFKTRNKFQAASPLYPRALVFNQNLVYAFNGHPSQHGYNVIELMEFDKENAKFELREIELKEVRGQKKLIYSTSTPKKCLECHTSDPRPIWNEYANWPGVYGSADDIIQGEKPAYADFLAQVDQEPDSRYALIKFKRAPFSSSYRQRINLLFTKLLVRMNALRTHRMLKSSPIYSATAPVVAYSSFCYSTPSELLKLKQLLNEKFGLKQVEYERTRDMVLKAAGLYPARVSMQPGAKKYEFSDGTESFLPVFEYSVVKDVAKTDAALRNAITFIPDYHKIRYPYNDLYPYVDSLIGSYEYTNGQQLCENVKVLATGAYNELSKLEIQDQGTESFEAGLKKAEAIRPNIAVPVSCVYCHSVKAEAPRIPFEDEALLKAELSADGERLYKEILDRISEKAGADRAMPPRNSPEFSSLSNEERTDFQKYLSTFVEADERSSSPRAR